MIGSMERISDADEARRRFDTLRVGEAFLASAHMLVWTPSYPYLTFTPVVIENEQLLRVNAKTARQIEVEAALDAAPWVNDEAEML